MPESNPAIRIIQAFIDESRLGLEKARESPQPMPARHSVNTIAKLTTVMLRCAAKRQELAPAQPELDRLVELGLEVSGAIPYQCRECGAIYSHNPPETTRSLCDFCLAETGASQTANHNSKQEAYR